MRKVVLEERDVTSEAELTISSDNTGPGTGWGKKVSSVRSNIKYWQSSNLECGEAMEAPGSGAHHTDTGGIMSHNQWSHGKISR